MAVPLICPPQSIPPSDEGSRLFVKAWWLFFKNLSGAVTDFSDEIAITGTIDGINSIFTADRTFRMLFRNGVCQRKNVDYTLSGLTIRFNAFSVPQVHEDGTKDQLWAF
jgi:hypothetical protein